MIDIFIVGVAAYQANGLRKAQAKVDDGGCKRREDPDACLTSLFRRASP